MFCKNCGCPLEVCCKPKTPVVSVEWLEKWVKENGWNEMDCNPKTGLLQNMLLGKLDDLLSTLHKQSKTHTPHTSTINRVLK